MNPTSTETRGEHYGNSSRIFHGCRHHRSGWYDYEHRSGPRYHRSGEALMTPKEKTLKVIIAALERAANGTTVAPIEQTAELIYLTVKCDVNLEIAREQTEALKNL